MARTATISVHRDPSLRSGCLRKAAIIKVSRQRRRPPMRIAYLDCFSGISGDMFLAALVDAGVPASLFEQTVAALNAAAPLEVRLEIRRVERSGISSTKVDVWVGTEKNQPRTEHIHQHHSHEHGHSHSHDHGVAQPPPAVHAHPHRGLKEIRGIIARAAISESAKTRALEIFQALGAAEAKVHNIPVEQVHFHEVGAADAIVDIVCAAVGSEALGADEWICSPLNVGSGSVECAHGRFPVPAPATAELLKDAPVFSSGIQAELVTPTGRLSGRCWPRVLPRCRKWKSYRSATAPAHSISTAN